MHVHVYVYVHVHVHVYVHASLRVREDLIQQQRDWDRNQRAQEANGQVVRPSIVGLLLVQIKPLPLSALAWRHFRVAVGEGAGDVAARIVEEGGREHLREEDGEEDGHLLGARLVLPGVRAHL